jgi:hypothetical protein
MRQSELWILRYTHRKTRVGPAAMKERGSESKLAMQQFKKTYEMTRGMAKPNLTCFAQAEKGVPYILTQHKAFTGKKNLIGVGCYSM